MNSTPFSKMLTDHMLNLQQEGKKFPFNTSQLMAAKNFSDYGSNGGSGADYSEKNHHHLIKNERLSPPNLKTEIDIEQQSSFSR